MEKIGLKKIVTHQNKTVIILICTGLFLALYTVSGALSYQNAVYLPMPEFEKNITFIPWTIWIYIVLYPIYLVWSLYSYTRLDDMNRTLYGFVLLTLLSCAFFLVFPVTYPRELYPLGIGNDLTTLIFRGMRSVDKPSNCLPSLHVGICYLFALGFYRENQRKFSVAMFISTLVALSTLTTKQHYIFDIVAGFLLSTGIYLFFIKYVSIEDPKDPSSELVEG